MNKDTPQQTLTVPLDINPIRICNHNSWTKQFPVVGQGVFILHKKMTEAFAITVGDRDGDHQLGLEIQQGLAVFFKSSCGNHCPLTYKKDPSSGLDTNKMQSYWYSYDRDNMIIKYGKGYRMEQTTIMTYEFPRNDKDDFSQFFNPKTDKFVRLYQETRTDDGYVHQQVIIDKDMEFDKNPFIQNISPLILDSSKANLFFLDNGNYLLSASLPQSARELYENVRTCELDFPAEVEDVLLSDAIRHSIETPGCLLFNKLKEKEGELGSDPNETYLRVTLGCSFANSPGIPYVLEIWPKGHFSPIHNHGNANAVIKVLFGSIHISIFNKHVTSHQATILMEFDAKAGSLTWVNRNWYQTHKLHNISDDFCATVQCYKYDEGDTTHWPYFDYISENETIEEFLPNSDFTFRDMRGKVLKEYQDFCQTKH